MPSKYAPPAENNPLRPDQQREYNYTPRAYTISAPDADTLSTTLNVFLAALDDFNPAATPPEWAIPPTLETNVLDPDTRFYVRQIQMTTQATGTDRFHALVHFEIWYPA